MACIISVAHAVEYPNLYLPHIPGAQRAKKCLGKFRAQFCFVLWSFTSHKTVAKQPGTSASRVFNKFVPTTPRSSFSRFCAETRPHGGLSRAGLRPPPGASELGSPRPGEPWRWRSGVSGTATPGRCGRLGEGPDAAERTGRGGKRAPCGGGAERDSVYSFIPLFSSPPPWSPAVRRSYRPKGAKARRKC